MRKSLLAATSLMIAAAAQAHPTGIPYDTRGECEAVFADASKFDRERLVEVGIFDTYGAAQRTFRDLFQCEYDPEVDAWFIVFIEGAAPQAASPAAGNS